MKTKYAIYGAGGFGREVRGILDQLSQFNDQIQFAGFIDDFIKSDEDAVESSYNALLMAIASPNVRRSLVEKINNNSALFSSLIHPDVWIHPTVKIGEGSIICSGVKMTVGITVGNFAIINLNATIGHDVKLGDYVSIMPSANISGNVTVGEAVLIGSGATILQGLTIGDNAIIGAGAVVTRSVPQGMTVVGIPARELK